MQFFNNYTKRIIVLFDPPNIYAYVINIRKKPFHILHARYEQCKKSTWSKGILINNRAVQRKILSFIREYNIERAYISIGLTSPIIFEQLECLRHLPSLSNQDCLTSYHYLYSTNDAQFCYYMCSIGYERLFQYQLLCTTLPVNLIRITTTNLARLYAYTKSYGNAFRQVQLANDMHICNYNIPKLRVPQLSSFMQVDIWDNKSEHQDQYAAIAGLALMDS